MLPEFAVLLASRGRRPFLENFLESLRNQASVSPALLVFSDGQSGEPALAAALSESGLRYEIVGRSSTPIGIPAAFLELSRIAQTTAFSYFAYADDDDIWMPAKLSSSLQALCSQHPTLWISDYLTLHADSETALRNAQLPFATEAAHAFAYGVAPGCTMAWNRSLMDAMRFPDSARCVMHDSWIHWSAMLIGTVIIDMRPLIWYRLHDSNTVGRPAGALRRLRNYTSDSADKWRLQAVEAIRLYGNDSDSAKLLESAYLGTRRKRLGTWASRRVRRATALEQAALVAYWAARSNPMASELAVPSEA